MRLENCHLQFDPPLRDGETEGDRLAELQRKMRSGQTGGWRDISEAPKDGTWFLAIAPSGTGSFGEIYPPTVCRVTRERTRFDNNDVEHHDGYSVECRAMNCASQTWDLSDFTHFVFLPEPPDVEG